MSRNSKKPKKPKHMPRTSVRFSGPGLATMRYRHWSTINRLLTDNSEQSFVVLLEVLRSKGVPYYRASGYLRTEIAEGKLTAQRKGAVWIVTLPNGPAQHPALANVKTYGNTTWGLMTAEERALARRLRMERHVAEGTFRGRPSITTPNRKKPVDA